MTVEEQAATLRPPEILALLGQQRELQEQNAALKRQVAGFQRQLFGRKSEKRLREPAPDQLTLAGMLTAPVAPADHPPAADRSGQSLSAPRAVHGSRGGG